MKKQSNEKTAKKLLIVGGLMFAISYMLNFAGAYSMYGKVNQCLDGANCDLGIEQTIGTIASIIGFSGIAVAAIGLVLLLISLAKSKRGTPLQK